MDLHDDLTDLLISGDKSPEGLYSHATWNVFTKGRGVTLESLIVSVHEAHHHLLNNTTAYGLALIVAGHLARKSDSYREILKRLVANSRTAHECYATYVGLLVASREHLAGEAIAHVYPGYEQYVKEARRLLGGVDAFRIQHGILNGAIRVCFQIRELRESLAESTPFNLDESPNQRLRLLQSLCTREYWNDCLKRFRDHQPVESGTKLFLDRKSVV